MDIRYYNDFLNDLKFSKITEEMLLILEESEEWIDDRTVVWKFDDVTKGDKKSETIKKLKQFLSGINPERVKEYFYKFLEKIKRLPNRIKRKLIMTYAGVFLSVSSIGILLSSVEKIEEIGYSIEEIKDILEDQGVKTFSNFEDAQEIVKEVEGGYSSDRSDEGNFVKTRWGKRFVGTNHGVSAPILMEYLGRIPTVEDMKNLSYETAIEIFKNNYWDKQNIELFSNQSVANVIYDGCINQGINGMKKILISVYKEHGIEIDSSKNPFHSEWIELANELDQEELFYSIRDAREKKYRKSKTFTKHGKGWLKRIKNISFSNS
jgi:lysozyme family protein